MNKNEIRVSGPSQGTIAKPDHPSVKENSNMNCFDSETDLLTKAYLIVDLLRSAKLNPDQFTNEYGIKINLRFKEITLTANEIINCCKNSWDLEITKEQIEFIFRSGTNYHLFVTHSVPQDDQTKIISYSYWYPV